MNKNFKKILYNLKKQSKTIIFLCIFLLLFIFLRNYVLINNRQDSKKVSEKQSEAMQVLKEINNEFGLSKKFSPNLIDFNSEKLGLGQKNREVELYQIGNLNNGKIEIDYFDLKPNDWEKIGEQGDEEAKVQLYQNNNNILCGWVLTKFCDGKISKECADSTFVFCGALAERLIVNNDLGQNNLTNEEASISGISKDKYLELSRDICIKVRKLSEKECFCVASYVVEKYEIEELLSLGREGTDAMFKEAEKICNVKK